MTSDGRGGQQRVMAAVRKYEPEVMGFKERVIRVGGSLSCE